MVSPAADHVGALHRRGGSFGAPKWEVWRAEVGDSPSRWEFSAPEVHLLWSPFRDESNFGAG